MSRAMMRLVTSLVLGALLPLAFIGGIALQGDLHLTQADRAAFCILLPLLLFGMMAFAIWILSQPAVSSRFR